MNAINRRHFLKSASGLVALATLDLASAGRAQQAPTSAPTGERLNVAVIGLGMRSQSFLNGFNARNNCKITHVCDPDTSTAARAIERAKMSNGGDEPVFVSDMRKIMDDKSVHIVGIVAPNHWHALASIWAMQAGKDVFVEKPISHTLKEGRAIVATAERTSRICQVGTQMRSNAALRDSMDYLHGGALGKVVVARSFCYKTRNSIGNVAGPQKPPETIDYNLWCGPAPLAPVMRTRFHYDWHWQWDFGNGDLGNQCAHEIDVALWSMRDVGMPKTVRCTGGRLGYTDDGQTANTQVASFDFGDNQPRFIVEVRGLTTQPYRSGGVENVIQCEKGYLVSPSYTSAIAYDLEGNILKQFTGGREQAHFDNFLSAVQSRKTEDLHCPAIIGHRASTLVHLANISYRLGEQVALGDRPKELFKETVADEAYTRMCTHLTDNKIAPETKFSIGKVLNFDPATETIANDAAATAMMTKEYRAPFAIPAGAMPAGANV